jgi:cytochrome c553
MRSILLRAAAIGCAALLQGCESPNPDTASAATGVASQPSSDAPEPPRQLGLCASCHGHDGIAVMANTPHLAGRDRAELLAAMQAYLDGSRDYAPMRAMLSPIAPAERERLADWFAAQPAPPASSQPAAPAGAPPGS